MDGYPVRAMWHPGFELVISVQTYLSADLHKVVDLGAAWRAGVRRQMPPAFASRLQLLSGTTESMTLLGAARGFAWSYSPAPAGTVGDFLAWIRELSVADLYAIAAARAAGDEGVSPDLPAVREATVELLTQWQEHYFAGIDPRITANLAAAAAALQVQAAMPGRAGELEEEVSGGIELRPDPLFVQVVLIPQYHARPWNIYGLMGRSVLHFYPFEALPPAPGEPSPRLTRMIRALNDAKRLAILRLVAGGPYTMTAIAKQVHLTKATVHYHLVLLRAAGLLRVETNLTKVQGNLYTLRRSALGVLPDELSAYIDG